MTYLSKEGREWRGSSWKVKCRAERFSAEKSLQFKGLSMGKARGLHGPSLGARGGQKQARGGHLHKCAFLEEGRVAVFFASLGAELLWSGPKGPRRSGEGCP